MEKPILHNFMWLLSLLTKVNDSTIHARYQQGSVPENEERIVTFVIIYRFL